MKRRLLFAAALVGASVLAWLAWSYATYPSDRTPEGAYLRVVIAVHHGRPQHFFAYLETPAQHACFTIGRQRKLARDRVLAAYPEPDRTELATRYRAEADAPDGPDVFATYAQRFEWIDYLRRDLSGVLRVEAEGERATVVTVRGTRYAFRRRENGIWGLTFFTARLTQDAELATRDAEQIEKAATDYERAARERER